MGTIFDVRVLIGRIWGRVTTLGLALGMAILAVPIPPEIVTPSIRWAMFYVAAAVAVLRVISASEDTKPTDDSV